MKKFLSIALAGTALSVCVGQEGKLADDQKASNVERALKDQILHVGLGPEPRSIDPHLANSVAANNIVTALLEGLVSEDPKTLEPIPGVAEKWTVSKNRKSYVFHLRKNAKWSNGDPVTAHDFVYSYKRVLEPELDSSFAAYLYLLEGAKSFHEGKKSWDNAQVGMKALDDHTLKLTLEKPMYSFLAQLNHSIWFPVHPPTIERHDAEWTSPGNFVGNGPFILTKRQANSFIMVERNPKYWDAAKVRLKGIRFYPIKSPDLEESAFQSGFLHLTQTVSADRLEALRKEKPNFLHFEPYWGTYFYRFNVDEPPFDDLRVRQAMSLAVDRESLVENVTKRGQLPAVSFTPPDKAGFTAWPRYKKDLVAAKKLINEYLADKRLTKLPPIELKYNTSEGHRKLAVAMQGMWGKNLGIEIKLLNMEWKVFLATTYKRDFVLARGGWIGDYLDAASFLQMWRANGKNNLTGWSNQRYDELLDLAAKESDGKKRFEFFDECEAILAKEMPIIPIYFFVHATLRHPTVKGWYPNLLDRHPYKFIYLEK